MTGNPKRSKAWGYEVEMAALALLSGVFWGLRRTGSVAYKKAAADLVRPGVGEVLALVVTRDKHHPLLVTLSGKDFLDLMTSTEARGRPVVVQVKGRERTWIGTLYGELRKACHG